MVFYLYHFYLSIFPFLLPLYHDNVFICSCYTHTHIYICVYPKYSLTYLWMMRVCYIYRVRFCSMSQRSETMKFEDKFMRLKILF